MIHAERREKIKFHGKSQQVGVERCRRKCMKEMGLGKDLKEMVRYRRSRRG